MPDKMANRIERWPIERLKPYERNARTHTAVQIQQIAKSIAKFGFTNPILVDSEDGIIAGHARLLAARELGRSEVPVIVLSHLSEAQKRAYILADNQLALNAGWDDEILRAELASLEAQGFEHVKKMGIILRNLIPSTNILQARESRKDGNIRRG